MSLVMRLWNDADGATGVVGIFADVVTSYPRGIRR